MTIAKFMTNAQYVLVGLMLLGVLGQRFQFLPFKAAFGGFALAVLIAAIIAVISLVVLALSFGFVNPAFRSPMATSFALGALPLVMMILIVGKGFKVPRIHDISTNLDNNLPFVHAQTLRRDSENSLDFPGEKVESMHREFYASLKPLVLDGNKQDAYTRAVEVARSLGWQVTHEDPASGTFEAYEKTALFGFVDDVVVRVAEEAGKVRLDMRSVSRVGVSDLGANAKRIERFQEAFLNQ